MAIAATVTWRAYRQLIVPRRGAELKKVQHVHLDQAHLS